MGNLVSFQVLGPLEMRINGRLIRLGGPRQRIILAMLLLAEGRVVSVDSLVEAIWNENPPATCRTQVSIGIAGIRKTVRAAGWDSDFIVTAPPGYRLVNEDISVDASEFSRLVAESDSAARDGDLPNAVDLLSEALSLWRGRAFAGIPSELVDMKSTRLEEERLLGYETRSVMQLQLGQHLTVAAELAPFVRDNPLREGARGNLMVAHYHSGRRAEALAVFQDGRRHLIEELGIEPGPVLQGIHDALLRDDVTVGRNILHRSRLVHPIPAQVPPMVPSFTGREREMALLDNLLGAPTEGSAPAFGIIMGGPGAGKTSLAIRWAHSVAEKFPDGKLFADLGGYDGDQSVVDADDILETFLSALGIPAEQLPPDGRSRTALYRSLLHGRQVLIVLDNVRTYDQIAPLLPGSSTCGVLVTSRSSYHDAAAGNETIRLKLAGLSTETSVEMLRKIVGSERLAADPVGTSKLVALCDGLPLALQTASVQLLARPHWTVSHLVHRVNEERRLDGLSQFDRELQSSFAVSYNRLNGPTAFAFRQVAQLEDDTFDSLAAATAMGVDPFEAEDLLEQLVDVYLLSPDAGSVRRSTISYRMSALLRLYARESASGELRAVPMPRLVRKPLMSLDG